MFLPQAEPAPCRIDEHVVAERHELRAQRFVQEARQRGRGDPLRRHQVGPADVPEEQRVARQNGFRALRVRREIEDEDRDPLGRVTRRLERAQHDGSQTDLVAVVQRLERVPGLGPRAEVDGGARAPRELEVSRHEIGVEMRQDHVPDRQAATLGVLDVHVHVAPRIDDGRVSGRLVADQVGSVRETGQIVLFEDHGRGRDPNRASNRSDCARFRATP